MSGFDEKLNALLSDPGSMAQVMQLAQQLSESFGGEVKKEVPPRETSAAPDRDTQDITNLMGTLDPGMLMKLLPLLQEMNSSNTQTMNLLYAIKPFLAEEKQGKIDRAAKLARLIHVGKKLFTETGGWGLV